MAVGFLLDRFANQLAFDYLRTSKQLGYVVQTSLRRLGDAAYLCLVLQFSADRKTVEVEVEKLLRLLADHLERLTQADVEQAASILHDANDKPFANMADETNYWFRRELEGHNANFIEAMRAEWRKASKAKLLETFGGTFKSNSSRIVVESLTIDSISKDVTNLVASRFDVNASMSVTVTA